MNGLITRRATLWFLALIFSVPLSAQTLPCDAELLETYRTEGIVYLKSETDVADRSFEFVPNDGTAIESIHEFVKRPDDNNWYTAIFAGVRRSGKLLVTNNAGTCEFALPGYALREKPNYAKIIVANPSNIAAKVAEVNQSDRPVELRLEDGEYTDGMFDVTISKVNVVAQNRGKAVFNGEWQGDLALRKIADTSVYKSTSAKAAIANIRQVHAKLDLSLERAPPVDEGPLRKEEVANLSVQLKPAIRIERLPAVNAVSSNADRPWELATLKTSPNGGWYVDSAKRDLYVKMPDGSDPSGKLHVSGPLEYAFKFTGDNVWVEGLVVKHYGAITSTPKRENHELVSGFRFIGNKIDVRHNGFRYNRGHAIVFGCENDMGGVGCASDVYTFGNRFYDSQTYLTYKQARLAEKSRQAMGHHLRPSDRVMYWKTTEYTHKGNVHHGPLQAVAVLGAIAGEIAENNLYKLRNIPIGLLDAQRLNGVLKEPVPGHSLTVARNKYEKVGFSVPNNEEEAQTGPAWWINNCVIDYGYTGNDLNHDTQAGGLFGGTTNSNRFGVILSEPQPIGVHFVYNNVISSNIENQSYKSYQGWTFGSHPFFAEGSKYYNNVLSSFDRDVEASDAIPLTPQKSHIWFGSHQLVNSSGRENQELTNIAWDYNQYWLRSGNRRAFGTGGGFELTHMQNLGSSFEANGSYSNPMISDIDRCIVGSPITHKEISGVTDNQFLFD